LEHVVRVVDTLCPHKLQANLGKYAIDATQIKYSSYIIDHAGIHVDSMIIKVIEDRPYPHNIIEL
jgi:hypothetical protein